eukprot:567744-Prymnesium_polylepis.2
MHRRRAFVVGPVAPQLQVSEPIWSSSSLTHSNSAAQKRAKPQGARCSPVRARCLRSCAAMLCFAPSRCATGAGASSLSCARHSRDASSSGDPRAASRT